MDLEAGPNALHRNNVNRPPKRTWKSHAGVAIYVGFMNIMVFLFIYVMVDLLKVDDVQLLIIVAVVAVLYALWLWSTIKAVISSQPQVRADFFLSEFTCVPEDCRADLPTFIHNSPSEYYNRFRERVSTEATEKGLQFKYVGKEAYVCTKCLLVTPPRAYHCDSCEKCVLRSEGHSNLFGQCIHYGNTKFATLSVLYGYLIFALMFAVCSVGFPDVLRNTSPAQPHAIFADFRAILCFISLACNLLFGGTVKDALLGYKHNITPEEYADIHPTIKYDTGSTMRNFQESIGQNWVRWWYPTAREEGDGITYAGYHAYEPAE